MIKNSQINKRIGKITQVLSTVLHHPIVWAPPQHISLEVTSFCNLRCPMCKLGQKKLGRDLGLMDFNKYTSLIDEVAPFIRRIGFPWYGEPFTRKDFGQFVKYASSKGMTVKIQTNGTLLYEHEIDYLVESNISLVNVAIDGLDQKTYETYRVGGNLEKVTEGVKRLLKLRNERKSKYPERIQMSFIVFKHNEHELPYVEEFGKKLGVDCVKIKSAHVERNDEGVKYLPSNPEYSRYEDGLALKSKRDKISGCPNLWRSAVISWDGTMGLCCFDYDCEYSPGNVFEEGFFKVWRGDKIQELRHRALNDKENISLCKRCHKSHA